MRKSKGMRRMAKGGMKMMRASKGGTKMMKARGGRMASKGATKGYAKGGVKKMMVGGMSISKLRTEAKKKGMKLVKA